VAHEEVVTVEWFEVSWGVGFFLDHILASSEAVTIHRIAKKAFGIAVQGEKCFRARTAPNPAFCIPTSIDNVRHIF